MISSQSNIIAEALSVRGVLAGCKRNIIASNMIEGAARRLSENRKTYCGIPISAMISICFR